MSLLLVLTRKTFIVLVCLSGLFVVFQLIYSSWLREILTPYANQESNIRLLLFTILLITLAFHYKICELKTVDNLLMTKQGIQYGKKMNGCIFTEA